MKACRPTVKFMNLSRIQRIGITLTNYCLDSAIFINLFNTEVGARDILIALISSRLWKSFPTTTRPIMPLLPCGVHWYKYIPGILKTTEWKAFNFDFSGREYIIGPARNSTLWPSLSGYHSMVSPTSMWATSGSLFHF